MANLNGDQFSSDPGSMAQGTIHDAGVRRFGNSFDLAVAGGGTTNTPIVAKAPSGVVPAGCDVSCTTNASGINFTLGTAADPDKYATAFAGPAANATVRVAILPAMLKTMLEEPETIILTPSGNMPANGTLVTSFFASKR
jgi:hypothetical protein